MVNVDVEQSFQSISNFYLFAGLSSLWIFFSWSWGPHISSIGDNGESADNFILDTVLSGDITYPVFLVFKKFTIGWVLHNGGFWAKYRFRFQE